jgi:RNA polymerase sigma-70 factor (ECF subfamily)
MNMENNDILQLFSVDEEKAFQQLFDLYYSPLAAIACSYLNDPDEAEDVVQQLFIKFWEEKHYRNINSSLKRYLSVALKNSCINHIARKKTHTTRLNNAIIEEEVTQAIDLLLENEQHHLFDKALNGLPVQSRRSLELVYFSGESYNGAATKMNISVNTIKSHLKSALRKLKNNPELLNYYKEKKK